MMKHRLITLTAIFFVAMLLMIQIVQAGELHDAAQAGYLQKVKLLLSQGADVNAKDSTYQDTPLHKAAYAGKTEVAELLIRKGADVNARGFNQATPLHMAAKNGNTEIVELLIRKGADVNARAGITGYTPLYEAVSFEVAELLIRKGADINARSDHQETPLYEAATLEVAELLILKGADINARDRYQETPLHSVASNGKTKIVELLISKGADINARDEYQKTPLHRVAYYGNTKMVELLIRKGADVNARDHFQQTPAMIAEKQNHPELAVLLRQMSGGSPRQELNSLISRMGIRVSSHDLKFAVRLVQKINPPPVIPKEAQEEMVKGRVAFKLANHPKGFDMAEGHFNKAALLAPWWPAPYYNMAMTLEKGRKFKWAKSQYKNYLIASPNAADAQAVKEKIAEMDLHIARAEQIDEHIKKANQYLANKNRAGAIEEIREAVRLEPDDAGNHFMLGHVLAYGGKHRAKEAITELKYAERLGIKVVELYWDLGNAYENLDEYDATIESYTKALALTIFDKEKKAKLHNNIGLAYEKKRNSKKALEHFKLAQKLGHPRKDYIRKQIRKHRRLLGR